MTGMIALPSSISVLRGRVLGGVLGQLQPRLSDPQRVEVGGAAGDGGEVPAVFGRQHVRLGEHLLGELGDIDVLRAQEAGGAGLGEQGDVVDQHVHPVELVDRELARGFDLVRVARVEQLEVAANDRDRRAQLVADVVEQPTLTVERPLEPVEHRVEGAGELGDVVAADHGDAAGEVVLADVLGGGLKQRMGRKSRPDTNQPTSPTTASEIVAIST